MKFEIARLSQGISLKSGSTGRTIHLEAISIEDVDLAIQLECCITLLYSHALNLPSVTRSKCEKQTDGQDLHKKLHLKQDSNSGSDEI